VRARSQPGAPAFEIADVFRAHGQSFRQTHTLSPEQRRAMRDIERCRTPALGGHLYRCATCAAEVVLYNSCLNRHCASCQGPAQHRWIEERRRRLLNTHCFHIVVTLPALLRPLALSHRRVLFDLLFAAAADTLLTLGRDPKRLGAELGFTLVLHTWTRDLRFHPHVHGIVPGGGLDVRGDRWRSVRQNFLFPVTVLSKLFRGKFLAALAGAHRQGQFPEVDEKRFRRLVCQLRAKKWITYAKRPFGGPTQVLSYLGRYTHRIGLSDSRLVAVCENAVTFRTKNSATVTLTPEEFLRRFLLHVLPPRFVKIRHYGLYAPANIHTRLRRAQEILGPLPQPSPDPARANTEDSDPDHGQLSAPRSAPLCPRCRTRTLRIVGDYRRRGYLRRFSHPPPDT
jgi:hypothetical protein